MTNITKTTKINRERERFLKIKNKVFQKRKKVLNKQNIFIL